LHSLIDFGFLGEFYRWFFVLLIPAGVILLFYGYRLFKLFLALIGFIFGLSIGVIAGHLLGEPVIIGLLSGILGAFLLYVLYKIGIFILGFVIGIIISSLLTLVASAEFHPAVFLLSGLFCGIAALFIEKGIIVTISSYQGAAFTVTGFAWLVYPDYMYQYYNLLFTEPQLILSNIVIQFLITIILTVVGILYQYKIIPNSLDRFMPGSFESKKEFDKEPKRSDKNFQKSEEIPPAKEKERKDEPIPESPVSETSFNERKNSDLGFTSIAKFFTKCHESISSASARMNTFFRGSFMKNSMASARSVNESAIRRITTEFRNVKSAYSSSHIKIPLLLHILNGPEQGTYIEIFGKDKGTYYSTTIGREASNERHHIKLSDPDNYVSRYHAELAMKDHRFFIRNLSHTNVLLLNGIEVGTVQFMPLHSGDVLELAYVKVEFLPKAI